MRVLLLSIAHFCDVQGGCQRIVQDEADELNRRGMDVWVLAPGAAGRPEHEVRDGINLLRYLPARAAAWSPARQSAHQNAARAVLATHLPRVDAIHGHALLTYRAALDFYGPSVHSCYTIHSPAKLEMAIVWRSAGLLRRIAAPAGLALLHRLEHECLTRSRVATALSQFTIDCIAKIHNEEIASAIRLLPGWADTNRFVPIAHRDPAKLELGWPTAVPVLFTLRRLAPRMGLDRLLDACSQLRAQGFKFHLVIGGGGPLRQKLQQQAEAQGLSSMVKFMGRIDDEKLPLAYGACDAFVLPTAELECFGIIALEALAAGRPVLATPVGAIPEIVSRFEPAWLASSASAADIARLLSAYLSGKAPEHKPSELHEQTAREFGRNRRLPAFVESVFPGALAGELSISRSQSS